MTTAGLLAALCALAVSIFGGVAQAAISTPTAGSTVGGDVWIYEARGGEHRDSLLCGAGGVNSWIEAYRADGTQIFRRAKGGAGAWGTTWVTHGEPRGQYRLRSTYVDRFYSWGCKNSAETQMSNFWITVDNTSTLDMGSPTAFSGESSTVSATLRDSRSNRAIAGRTVAVTTPDGTSTATTNSSGVATVTVAAGLPVGQHAISAQFVEDSAWRGSTASGSYTVLHRPVGIAYTGDTAATFGQTANLSATLTDSRAATPVEGAEVTFSFERMAEVLHTVTATSDADGIAAAELDIDMVGGSYVLRTTYAGSDTLAPASSVSAFQVARQASATAYDGDVEAYWTESAAVRATVTGLGGSPVEGGTVTFTLGSSSATADVVDGVATTTLDASDAPGTATVTAQYSGDGYFLGSTDGAAFTIKRRPTTLTYDGDRGAVYGQTATLSATLRDERGETAVAGREVLFTVGDWFSQAATTDADGVASVQIELTGQDPGSYALSATFAGDGYYVGAGDAATFVLGWEYAFTDDASPATVYLNTATRQFQFDGIDESSGVKTDPNMRFVYAVRTLGQPAGPAWPDQPEYPAWPIPTTLPPEECDPHFYPLGCVPPVPNARDLIPVTRLPEVPATPNLPVPTPSVPGVPTAPDAPGLPDDDVTLPDSPQPDAPSLPGDGLSVPARAAAHDGLPGGNLPDAADVPGAPDVPGTPELPEPNAPELPGPDAPELPGTPEPSAPELPGTPELPELPTLVDAGGDADFCATLTESECELRYVIVDYRDTDVRLLGQFDVVTGEFAAVVETATGRYLLSGSGDCGNDLRACLLPGLPSRDDLSVPERPEYERPERPEPPVVWVPPLLPPGTPVPDAPDAPDAPGLPDAPGAPGLPGAPDEPQAPDLPGLGLGIPQLPAPALPSDG